uniref:Uncharacterized protein n=1 Tax=Arundo donax TaxID=35708 RepID=A0A0A9A6A8_ARUDO
MLGSVARLYICGESAGSLASSDCSACMACARDGRSDGSRRAHQSPTSRARCIWCSSASSPDLSRGSAASRVDPWLYRLNTHFRSMKDGSCRSTGCRPETISSRTMPKL